jgi:hypothetical protein
MQTLLFGGAREKESQEMSQQENTMQLATIEQELPAVAITPMGMLQMAVAKGASLEQLQQLMALQERYEANEARKAFNRAFSEFKSEAIQVIRNKPITAGPLQGKSYADLFAVVTAVTPKLSQHGLSASWKLTKDEKDWLEVTCTITHALGHSESVAMGAAPDAGGAKNNIQARASAVTYLERYTLMAVCGLAAQDMDNDGAGGKSAVEPDAAGKKILEDCGSLASLNKAWSELTKEQRKTLAAVKDTCKARIEDADK